MEEILISVGMTIIMYVFMILVCKKGW